MGQRFLITGALGAIGVWTMRSLLGSVMGPVEDRVTESVRRFEDLIARGLVEPPAPQPA